MKINSLHGTVGYTIPVREKKDGGQNANQEHTDQKDQETGKDQPPKEPLELDASPEKVDQAIEAFQSDTLAQENGLSASLEGTGPGLRVVLKDGGGQVVRQLTGEEFLRLRQATTQEGRTPGKILDQKL